MVPASILFQSPTVRVADWRCPGHDTPAGSEEWCDGYEVTISRTGAYQRASGPEAVFADPGAAVFYSPVRGFRIRHPAGTGDSCTIIRIPEAGLRALLDWHAPSLADGTRLDFPASHVELDGPTHYLQSRALHAASSNQPLLTEELAVRFLNRAVAQAAATRGFKANFPAAAAAVEYAHRVREVVSRRFRERLSLEEIARAVHCSPFHLARLFRSATGRSIHQFLVQIRVRHALTWLRDTRHDLSRIALDAGFATHSHFSEAFRREFGAVPSAVRNGSMPSATPIGSLRLSSTTS